MKPIFGRGTGCNKGPNWWPGMLSPSNHGTRMILSVSHDIKIFNRVDLGIFWRFDFTLSVIRLSYQIYWSKFSITLVQCYLHLPNRMIIVTSNLIAGNLSWKEFTLPFKIAWRCSKCNLKNMSLLWKCLRN